MQESLSHGAIGLFLPGGGSFPVEFIVDLQIEKSEK
jgi:hypothetical protein